MLSGNKIGWRVPNRPCCLLRQVLAKRQSRLAEEALSKSTSAATILDTVWNGRGWVIGLKSNLRGLVDLELEQWGLRGLRCSFL